MMGRIRKAIAPPVVGLLGVLGAYVESGTWDLAETSVLLGSLVTALFVYALPNDPAVGAYEARNR